MLIMCLESLVVSESTNKVMFTGKKETVNSEITGIYVFRAVDVP